MRKPLSLAHKVKITGRRVDLQHTDVAATFARVRREQARVDKPDPPPSAPVVVPMRKKA